MIRFLLATIPVIGHVSPMLVIAEELIKRGHDVQWYSGQRFRQRIEATGAQFVPMDQGIDYSIAEQVPSEWVEQRQACRGLAQLKCDLQHFFIEAAIGYTQDLLQHLKEFPADIVLADSFFIAAGWLHEAGGPPWVQLGVSVLSLPSENLAPFGLGLLPSTSSFGRVRNALLQQVFKGIVFRDIQTYLNEARRKLSLPERRQSFFEIISPYLYLANVTEGFEYPRNDLPAQVKFIGPLQPSSSKEFSPPIWWDELAEAKTVILVTQGTVALNPEELIIPAIEALADQPDLLVVVTTGMAVSDSLSHVTIPSNVRAEQFIPFNALLPHVDIVITNGGYNGVQMALAQGIPLMVAGKSEDKSEVCARVAWSGAGIRLKSHLPKPMQIKQAIQKIMAEPQYRQNAERLQAEIQQCSPAEQAASQLEALYENQRP